MSSKIIGIAGTNGSGKDTIGQILAEKHNYLFVTVTEMLREECRRRGLPVEREHLRMISGQWRAEGGLGVLVDKAKELYDQQTGYNGLAISSLRNPGEADRVHELGGKVVWVDADPHVRYGRIQSANRGRGTEDNKTFEEFLQEERAEMYPPEDADRTALNGAAVREKCDLTLMNDDDQLVLEQKVENLIS